MDLIKLLVIIASTIWESIWRRGFGSSWYETESFLKNRAVIHAMNIFIFLIPLMYYKMHDLPFTKDWYLYASIIYITLVVEGLFWSRGHGFAFDCGRGEVDDEMIKRYEKMPYNHYFLTPLFKALGLKLYGYAYDCFSMLLRYTLPTLLLIPFYKWYIIFMGIIVAITYAFCWTLTEKGENPNHGPTTLAERIAGGTTGLFLSWLCINGIAIDYMIK